MKLAILVFLFSLPSFSVEVEGHLRHINSGWKIIPVDKSAPTAKGNLCGHEDFKDYRDLFVKASVRDTPKGKCFEVDKIELTVLDPMGGSLKPFKKKINGSN